MKDIGIPPHIQGYHYLKEAISQVMDNPALLNKVTKELYPNVAERMDSTPTRVERSIRHAIELVWNRDDTRHISAIFGYSEELLKEKPTNSKFIAMIVNSTKNGQGK
ncbi:sporulation initiation factor Spo0A C-terminal domain-containing protein [Planococcus koreensis]